MDKLSRTTVLFLLFCVLFTLQFQRARLDDEGGQNVAENFPEKPLVSQLLIDTVSLLRKSHKSSWEKIKTVIHDLQMQFSPPNLDFRSSGEGGTLKQAVEKSFDQSKEAVKESAESVAKVVDGALHKKETTDSEKESKAEL